MNKQVDIVFVTHLPAFYKVNLYRAIAQHCRVFVIFIGQSSTIRTPDFEGSLQELDHLVLDSGCFEQRSVWQNCRRLRKVLQQLSYRQLIVGGWDLPEYWMAVWSSPKQNNALALESSCYESVTHAWRGWLKKCFLSRIATVFHSGIPHLQLLSALKYTGETKITLGVGIFHREKDLLQQIETVTQQLTENGLNQDLLSECQHKHELFQGKFLFVGRCAPEKNVGLLLSAFAAFPEFSLTIVGDGPLKTTWMKQAPPNVHFRGYVSNEELPTVYKSHDVFVLPSLKEPWGLVVEEALYYGLPVLASHKVGCGLDWIVSYNVGKLFDPGQVDDLKAALVWIQENYTVLKHHMSAIDFNARDQHQVQQYVKSVV